MLITRLLILFGFLFNSVNAKSALVDRQILEVETISYTQRQFEIYFLVKQLLLSRNEKPELVLRQENWSSALEEYKNEVLIHQYMDQEAQRLSSLFPNKNMLETAYDMVQNRSHKVTVARELIDRHQIRDEEIKRSLVQVLKVQNFLKSRIRLQEDEAPNQNWGYDLDESASWFFRIQQSLRYRFYEQAREYKEIRW
ncbi:MAG: hypothetical protein ACOH5I_16235 [Oligoflexus sp.]